MGMRGSRRNIRRESQKSRASSVLDQEGVYQGACSNEGMDQVGGQDRQSDGRGVAEWKGDFKCWFVGHTRLAQQMARRSRYRRARVQVISNL